MIEVKHLAAGVTANGANLLIFACDHTSCLKGWQKYNVVVRHQLERQPVMQIKNNVILFAFQPVNFPVEMNNPISCPLGHIVELNALPRVQDFLLLTDQAVHLFHQWEQLCFCNVITRYQRLFFAVASGKGANSGVNSNASNLPLDFGI